MMLDLTELGEPADGSSGLLCSVNDAVKPYPAPASFRQRL
jgi:hypothetical protein